MGRRREQALYESFSSGYSQGGAWYHAGQQEKRMRDIFEAEQAERMEERDAATMINQVYQSEVELSQKRSKGAQTLGQIRNLVAQDPSVRKTTAPVILQALEEANGAPIAENLKQFVMTAKPEVAGPVLDRIIRGYTQDPNKTIDDLAPFLSSPLTSAQTIGQVSRQLSDVAAQEAITGPAPNPRRDKFLQARATRERQIKGLERVVAQYGHTKAAAIAQRKIEQLQGELEKMENIIAGSEAASLGVRPGTTLTETGAGGYAVLQAPDDSETGGGTGALKTSDERAMFAFLAPIYADSFNLETGEFKTKTREDSQRLLDVLARAARIRAESNGRLTAAEAAQKAQRELGGAGAGAPGATGGNIYDQFEQPGM